MAKGNGTTRSGGASNPRGLSNVWAYTLKFGSKYNEAIADYNSANTDRKQKVSSGIREELNSDARSQINNLIDRMRLPSTGESINFTIPENPLSHQEHSSRYRFGREDYDLHVSVTKDRGGTIRNRRTGENETFEGPYRVKVKGTIGEGTVLYGENELKKHLRSLLTKNYK